MQRKAAGGSGPGIAGPPALPSPGIRVSFDMMSHLEAASAPPTRTGSATPSSQDPHHTPRAKWRLLGYAVVTGGVLALLLLSLGALWLVTAQQFLEETRGEWTQARRATVLELERYWLFGDPEAAEAYREARSIPARVREPVRYAFRHPGDASGLRPLLEQALEPERARGLYHFSRWFGGHRRTLAFLDLSVQADEVFLQVDSLATAMEAAGLPGAIGDPERADLLQEALDELRELDREAEALTEAIGITIREWSRDLQALIRNFLVLVAGVVLVVGMLLLRDAARRASRSEEAAREAQTTLVQLTQAIPQVFWLTPPDKSRMLHVSPAYEEIWGRPVEELYRDPRTWMAAIHAEDRSRVEQALPLQDKGEYDVEYRIVTPNGLVRWIRDRAFPIRNEAGEVIRVAGVAEDVTGRREMEEQVLRSRNLRSLGRLAASVAHHFNNHLTVILGQVELAREEHPDDDELREDLATVKDAATRARELTRSLLALAREQPLVPRPVDLSGAVRESLSAARSIFPEGVQVTADLAPLAPAWVDPSYLRETLVGMAVLARDHLPHQGTVTVRTRTTELDGPLDAGARSLDPGRWVVLDIEHSEGTLTEAVRRQLLDPFEAGAEELSPEQAGMGLASIQGFAEQSGGGLRVEGSGERGLRLRLFLPLASPEGDRPAEE